MHQRKVNGCWWPLDVAEKSRRMAVLVMVNGTIWSQLGKVCQRIISIRGWERMWGSRGSLRALGQWGASIGWNMCIKLIFWYSRSSDLNLMSSHIWCSVDLYRSSDLAVFPGEQSQYLYLPEPASLMHMFFFAYWGSSPSLSLVFPGSWSFSSPWNEPLLTWW